MEIGQGALPLNLETNKDFISQICVDPEAAIPKSVKGIIENFKDIESPEFACILQRS